MARAVVYRHSGGPEVLSLEEMPDATPGPGEVVVAVRAIGVNPIDVKQRTGARAPDPAGEPRRIGQDAAGVVEAVGDGVDSVSVGDEVIVRRARGAYATQVVARADQLVRKPAELGWTESASIGVPVATAYQVLRSLGVGEGDTLLLHGGSGSVGQAAIQFAVAAGARVIATASERNHDRIRALGGEPVAYGAGLEARVRELAPRGVTVAIDCAGTDEAIEVSLALVADRDRIATIVRGRDAAGWGIRAFSGGNPVPLTDEEQRWRDEGVEVGAALAAEGRFDLEVGRTYRLEDAAEAQRASESGEVRGKIVLLV
ncbi:NADP-dependent oxidoreductase [Agromyces sp. Marseille-P2726]|uniref:quinone oxidoreductase family protein n=1 Tax=Agromyces sp. Marseille-P2726 TaxID=2709132 RepID=UPI0015708D6D|nr:NADP-dependent oxidoreductase [Agromyces sp. Marseille-P2726]